ncbi:ribosome recycling factor [bacterium]|nr:MAG: ribosome recycling factor [bacterium]
MNSSFRLYFDSHVGHATNGIVTPHPLCSTRTEMAPPAFYRAPRPRPILFRRRVIAILAVPFEFPKESEPTMPVDDVLLDAEIAMDKTVEHLSNELKTVRTGRATPAIVEHVKVEYYGGLTDIKSIAAISIPEATQIIIKPFQKSDLKAIERAISDSKTGLTAHSDGTQLRNARRDANKVLETEKKGGLLREDELDSGKEQIDELTKKTEAKLDALVAKKTSELMDV